MKKKTESQEGELKNNKRRIKPETGLRDDYCTLPGK